MIKESFSIVQRHKDRGIKTWYIRTNIDGRIAYKSTKTTIKAEAMKVFAAYANDRKNEMARINGAKAEDINVIDEAHRWLEIQEAKFGCKGRTFLLYRGNVKNLVEYLDRTNSFMLPRITRNVAQGLANEMMKSGKKASTIAEDLKCIKVFFNWLIETYDLTIKNPFLNIEKPTQENHIAEFWTTDELDAIIANVDGKYYKAFYGLQCYAGLRYNEARKVMVENISEGRLTIRQDKKKSDAVIPISAKLMALLADAIDGRTEGSLFDGHICNHAYRVAKPLKDAVGNAGLEGRGRVFMHRLRHSFASNLLRNGVDVKSVQVLGRWSSPNILLKHYAGVIPDELADAVNLL